MSDLQHLRIAELCQELRLSAVPNLYPGIAQGTAAKDASFADFLEETLRGERDARSARAREMFARVAGFPAIKTLDGFDFGFATGVPRPQIHELAGLAFIERAENVVFLGPSGVGKTHLAIALGYLAELRRFDCLGGSKWLRTREATPKGRHYIGGCGAAAAAAILGGGWAGSSSLSLSRRSFSSGSGSV
jgi:DNA replication protein DnaC